jgi:uncharacterized protein YqgV (UPF0045/DUF77 family)
MKTTIESEWKELLTEMQKAHKHGVPGVGPREIADVERTIERVVRCERESARAVARMFLDYLGRGKSRLPATNNA